MTGNRIVTQTDSRSPCMQTHFTAKTQESAKEKQERGKRIGKKTLGISNRDRELHAVLPDVALQFIEFVAAPVHNFR